mgnify:CR=1 FL=1
MSADEFWDLFTKRELCVHVRSREEKIDFAKVVRDHGLPLGGFVSELISGGKTGGWGGIYAYMSLYDSPPYLTACCAIPKYNDIEMGVIQYDEAIEIINDAQEYDYDIDLELLI